MRIFRIIILSYIFTGFGQNLFAQTYCNNPKFEKEVASYLSNSVPVIGCEELDNNIEDYCILDARELEEYETSHLPGALYIGYKQFDYSRIKEIPKDQAIVVYCSIGYRSEKVGEKLKKAGFTNVKNLYGSIFEWGNQGRKLIGADGNQSSKIHGYNKSWSRWIQNKELSVKY